MFGTIQMDVYVNMYVSEAAIPQIVAIRYCAHLKKKIIRVPPFRYLGWVLQCAVFPHTPVHDTLARFCSFSFFPSQSTTKLPFKHGPKTTYSLALVKPNRVKACLRQGASSAAPSPVGGGQGSRRSRDRSRLRRNHQCTGRVQCTGT